MMMDEQYMQRCIELAKRGQGYVAPNPLVGAVLVHENKVIGEGWHALYGSPHAEVNCIHDAIQRGNESLIPTATLYVCLEPCAHHGKTPPCDQLIIQYKIPRVVIGSRDPFPEVNGRGIAHLIDAGVEVQDGVAIQACRELNKRFFCFHEQHRPYIILKWAESADGWIGSGTTERWLISSAASNQMVHQLRSREAAIMVGSNTVRCDNPFLTNRSGSGRQPVRLVADRKCMLTDSYHVFKGALPTIVLNESKQDLSVNPAYYRLNPDLPWVNAVGEALYQLKIQSVIIEGGAALLQLFLDADYWDEAIVIRSEKYFGRKGVRAPVIKGYKNVKLQVLDTDTVNFYISRTNPIV